MYLKMKSYRIPMKSTKAFHWLYTHTVFLKSGFFFAGLTLGRSLTNAKTVAKPLNAPLCYR